MTQISQPQAQTFTSPPGKVLGMTMVHVRGVKYADASGRINVGGALLFGKDPVTGKPKVAFMNPEKVSENFVQPTPTIEAGIIKMWEAEGHEVSDLPDVAPGSFEIGEIP